MVEFGGAPMRGLASCSPVKNRSKTGNVAIQARPKWHPAGRPRGARSKITVAVETLIDGAADDIANKAIELAKAGDPTMLRALLDRVAPARRDRHIPFELPPRKRRPMR